MWQLSALVLSWLVFQLEGNHWLFLFVSKKNSTVTLELEPNSALGQIFVTNILLYSPVHKCWPKTSLSGNQGKHQNRPILATKEPLTAFHGSKQKKHKKCIFCQFWVTLMPFTSIYPTDPRTNPTHFHKKLWELIVLKNLVILSRSFWIFFSKIFFCWIPW